MRLIISKVFAQNTSNVFDQGIFDLPPVLIELKNMAQMTLSNENGLEDIENSQVLSQVIESITEFKMADSDSKMSLLWLQYLHAIEVFLMFFEGRKN